MPHAFSVCFCRIPDVSQFPSPSPAPGHVVVQPSCLSAVLVPVGMGVADWSEFGQCLCMDWSPGNESNKLVAGFSNGTSEG